MKLVGYYTVQTADSWKCLPVSWQVLALLWCGALQECCGFYCSGLVRMNTDLYNYHIWASSTWPTPPLSDPSIHFGSHIHFCCSWNDGTCWWSFGQSHYSFCCKQCEGDASTVPFGLPSPIASTLGQQGLWGASAFGAEDCLSTATHQIPIVNSVHFSGSSFTQVVLFRVLL